MSTPPVSVEGSVADWLANQGYVLEYVTHRALWDAGLPALMSSHVENLDGTWREIDVSAMEQAKKFETECPSIVRLFCECKYSRQQPWVLLTSGLRAHLFADWSSLPKSPELQELESDIANEASELASTWHFSDEQVFAHALVQAHRKDNRDAAFDALQKITNAAWDMAEAPSRKNKVPSAILVIPCLIVDAPLLWSYYHPVEQRFIVSKVPYGRLSWSGCRGGTIVDVVQSESLPQYASSVRTTFSAVLPVLERFAGKILKRRESRVAIR